MKGAKIQNDISWLFYNVFLFQNIKIKLKSRTWMTLKSSVVIFQALEPLQPQRPHWPLQPQWPRQPQKKKFLILMVESSLAPKWPILASFCGIDHQKSNFSLISYTLSVRGCWGQLMLIFWKPSMYIKNSQSLDSKTMFEQYLTCIFLSSSMWVSFQIFWYFWGIVRLKFWHPP